SYCILVSSAQGQETRQRLKALCATNDGFQIAEEDLKLRGPGDFFGSRQHGLPPLRVADLASDVQILYEARDAAQALLQQDPELSRPEHQGIRQRTEELFEASRDTFN
ncbi:MAG: ATP-dependent DNA helicase RecG, partial [Clostridiales bacterium]|nr:ATP-dependent DNA helicase RecG [Clostridiales bacterium]